MEFQNLINEVIIRRSESTNDLDASHSFHLEIGLAVWDIFSNNNTAVNRDGTDLDLGSWREAAGSIANSINSNYKKGFESSDFYKGTEYTTELKPVDQLDNYKEIFLLLHEQGWDWKYASEIEYAVCVTDPYPLQAYKSVFRK